MTGFFKRKCHRAKAWCRLQRCRWSKSDRLRPLVLSLLIAAAGYAGLVALLELLKPLLLAALFLAIWAAVLTVVMQEPAAQAA